MEYVPGRVLSQVEIEEEIVRLVVMLEEETDLYAILIEDAAAKEARHKAEWAKAYMNGEGSVANRESFAHYQLADELFSWKVAEALTKAKAAKLASTRTAIDALRTLAANVRAQV